MIMKSGSVFSITCQVLKSPRAVALKMPYKFPSDLPFAEHWSEGKPLRRNASVACIEIEEHTCESVRTYKSRIISWPCS